MSRNYLTVFWHPLFEVFPALSPLLLFSWDDHVNLTGERDFRQILAQTTPTLPQIKVHINKKFNIDV